MKRIIILYVCSVKTHFDPTRLGFSAARDNFDPESSFDAASLSSCQGHMQTH